MNNKSILSIAGIFLMSFGLLTLFMSTAVNFDLLGIRAKQGNYVPFIVWANWCCGLMYLAASYYFFKPAIYAKKILSLAVLVLIVAFIGLLFHINSGGLYEVKTVKAMIFRTTITIAFLLIAHFYIDRSLKKPNKPK